MSAHVLTMNDKPRDGGSVMTRAIRSLLVAALFVAAAVPLRASVVPPGGTNVRQELAQYFANISRNSPTVLGDLASSPATMAAIQQRIATMSDEEVAKFGALMAQTPDWKAAPEAFAKAFPPEMLEQIRRVGDDTAAQVPRGEEMRDDVKKLTTVLKVLPDAKLKELGIDRKQLESLDATFGGLSPAEAAMLHRELSTAGPWDSKSAAAMRQIPPELQRGAAALAEHGPLTDEDVKELTAFRKDLDGLLARIDKLPPETQKTLKVDELRARMSQLDTASPDVLFMVRANVTPQMVKSLGENVEFLEKIANLSPAELKDLETFRSDLTSAFEPLEKDGAKTGAKEMLATLGPAELMLLKQGMSTFGNWQTALPAFYATLAQPDLPKKMAAVQGANIDPAVAADLEAFRAKTLAELDAAAGEPGADTAFIEKTREKLVKTPLARLELMRLSLDKLPATASTKDKMAVIGINSYNFDCYVHMPDPIPNISLDFICNPIEDALNTIANSITATVNTIVSSVQSALNTTISTLSNTLNAAINTVSSTVNSLISGITSTVTSISSFLQTIPTLAWEAIQSALNLLLDIEIRNGVTLRHLVASGAEVGMNSMKTLLDLSPGWWTAVSTFTLPQIPCPPAGFHTPWGDVGDGAAAANYGRYRIMIDNLIGLIPDTETSLEIKIPAQILYMAYDFLGVCLEQAASDADSALAEQRHNMVIRNFANLQTFIGQQTAGLALQQGNQTTQLTTLINDQSSALRGTVLSESAAIQALINDRATTTRSIVNRESNEIQTTVSAENDHTGSDLDAFQQYHLRLAIERVLQAGVGSEIALFELLEPLGYLRMTSDIVRETIANMATAAQTSGQAQKFYDAGVALMNAGSEKQAFKLFGQAYRAATSQ